MGQAVGLGDPCRSLPTELFYSTHPCEPPWTACVTHGLSQLLLAPPQHPHAAPLPGTTQPQQQRPGTGSSQRWPNTTHFRGDRTVLPSSRACQTPSLPSPVPRINPPGLLSSRLRHRAERFSSLAEVVRSTPRFGTTLRSPSPSPPVPQPSLQQHNHARSRLEQGNHEALRPPQISFPLRQLFKDTAEGHPTFAKHSTRS